MTPKINKKIIIFFIFYFILKFNRLLSYCFYILHVINIKERVDVNQDGPNLIIEAPPPNPGPQIA